MGGGTAEVDKQLLLMFRNTDDLSAPIGARWIEELMRDITGWATGVFRAILSFMLAAQMQSSSNIE